MKKRNEEVPDYLGEFLRPDGSKRPEVERGNLLPAELMKLLNELLEHVHQSDHQNKGSNNTFIYVAPGAQYVKNLYQQQQPLPDPPQKKPVDGTGKATNPPFDADTPLTALFRENHHEELRKVIDSWRPYLIDDDPTADALVLTRFEFDKDRIYSNKVYRDLCGLDVAGALKVPLSQMARYLTDHSNLSRSYATLYQQLKYYRSEWT